LQKIKIKIKINKHLKISKSPKIGAFLSIGFASH